MFHNYLSLPVLPMIMSTQGACSGLSMTNATAIIIILPIDYLLSTTVLYTI